MNEMAIKYGLKTEELADAVKRINRNESFLFTMSGKMGAGKDTVGDLVSTQLMLGGHEIITTSFGYLIKKELQNTIEAYRESEDKEKFAVKTNANKADLDKLSELLRFDTAFSKTDESRLALQIWGTDIRRKQQSDYWIKEMARTVIYAINKEFSVNITDARFPNEVELVEDLSGKIIRLEVPEEIRVKRIQQRDNILAKKENLNHLSETALDDYPFERVFDGKKSPKKLMKESLEYIIN